MGCSSSKFQISPIPQDCPICYKTIEDTIITPCNHQFCNPCLTKWIEISNRTNYEYVINHFVFERRSIITCPVCRKSIEHCRKKKYPKNNLTVMIKRF